MIVENALILAAGAGTRMGEIGKVLPKVLWPVFECSLLELEVLYAQSLGVKNIFINSHYYTKEILEHVKENPTFKNVTILLEKEPIDIGGAVHNLARKLNYSGELLILNSDQFIFINEKIWNEALNQFRSNDCLLFSYEVNSDELYNALDVGDGLLKGVIKNSNIERNKTIKTYTGMSLIRLESLSPSIGKSSFFESVANFTNKKVGVIGIKDSEYWDFGTLDRYWKSCFSILERIALKKHDRFIDFLLRENALDRSKVNENCYNANESENVINLSKKAMTKVKNKILLSDGVSPDNSKKSIVFNNIVVEL